MSSKCPHQRSEFYGPEVGMMRNALATHVLDVGQGHKEVFLNLSFWGNNTDNLDPVIETIKTLSEWKEKLIAVTCDHVFILNSTTETKCQLGCTHSNLNDKEAMLVDMKPEADFKVTFEDVKETYIDFLGTQMNLAKTYLQRLCPNLKTDDPGYDEFRRWYFVFQDEMDQIKYAMQHGLTRLTKDQPYRKKYEVSFGYKSDIPRLHTDDIFQAEAVWKHYKRSNIECWISELRPEKKDSTSIQYFRLDPDPDLRLRCCACKEHLNPGDPTVIAELVQEDKKGRETPVHNHGEVMHKKCHKKITDKNKEFHRCVTIQLSDKELSHFHDYRSYGNIEDITTAIRDRWDGFRYMQITDAWETGTRLGTIHGRYRIRVKGLGHQFDELKMHLKPLTKKEK